MDITATNFDELAEEEGPCSYESTTLNIYENGNFSAWNGNNFVFLACQGSVAEVPFDSTQVGLALVADTEGKFFGFIQALNVNEGRYFATPESKLNFSARLSDTPVTDTLGVFIRGQEPETIANCQDVLISDRIMFSTESLSNTAQNVSMNIQNFNNVFLQNVGIVAGFEFEANPLDTLMIINSVNWTNF